MSEFDLSEHNKKAWDAESIEESQWCTPVDSQVIEQAKRGNVLLKLTPNRILPSDWLRGIKGKKVLCLAAGGGQQAPILAAAGANVTSFDLSKEQLKKDMLVADRDGLEIHTVNGDMNDLSVFGDESFDLIVNGVSNIFIPELRKFWSECHRILRPGGELWAAFMNPSFFLFDHDVAAKDGELKVRFSLPYSDFKSLEREKLDEIINENVPVIFGHTLEEQIGGQTEAGFLITGLIEDNWSDDATPLNKYSSTTVATRALKK